MADIKMQQKFFEVTLTSFVEFGKKFQASLSRRSICLIFPFKSRKIKKIKTF